MISKKKYHPALRSAAVHHFEAGNHLYDNTSRKNTAGYLYGFAAECAIKEIMRDSGMCPLENRNDDPFFAHFEELKTLLRDAVQGRRQGELRRFAENSAFMQHWDTSMRYSDGKEIKLEWIARWKKDAKQAIDTMQS